MASYKAPDFNQRTALAREAKLKALEGLKARPPVDEALVAERKAARLAREAADSEKRRLKREAEQQKKAAKREKLAEAEPPVQQRSEAELKAARDARYAARKSRKK